MNFYGNKICKECQIISKKKCFVYASSQDDILELNFTTNRLTMKFVSQQAEEIANSITHIQSRWKLSQPVSYFFRHH